VRLNYILFLLAFTTFNVYSQTLVINEFSNGTGGTKEWVELIVISTNSAPCNPDVLDLRGWIIDDNNGYFGTGGIAQGCNRFSTSSFWSAVPVGTLITIYNNADSDPYFTPSTLDVSLTDGNCKLTFPISNSLIEQNSSLPSQTNQSYPTTGWVAGGLWSLMGMNNNDDSFQIRNPAQIGAPIFDLSYGAINNMNNLIYFPVTGGQQTFYAKQSNSCDWRLQSNWTYQPAAGNESPTQPNSAENSSCIGVQAQNCNSTTPTFEVTVSNDTTICFGGNANLEAFGATTYSWDNGLGSGSQHTVSPANSTWYRVEGTTGGCSDDDSIFVEVLLSSPIQLMNDTSICVLTLSMATNTGTIDQGQWSFQSTAGIATFQNPNNLNQTVQFDNVGNYDLIYTESKCALTDTLKLTVLSVPLVESDNLAGCFGEKLETFVRSKYPNIENYLWSTGDTTPTIFIKQAGTYSLLASNICGNSLASFEAAFLDCTLEMPNVFSPNGDGINEFYYPILNFPEVIVTLNCQIFNRWGNKMFEFQKADKGWDGTTDKGVNANDGTYYFIVVAEIDGGEVIQKQGFFSLVRN
jgi:gliding motility-associated-like protein